MSEWIKAPAFNAHVRWEPTTMGDAIVGRFCGFTERDGQHGPFTACSVRTNDGTFQFTARGEIAAFEAAGLRIGDDVRVVFDGHKGPPGRRYRVMSVFVRPL